MNKHDFENNKVEYKVILNTKRNEIEKWAKTLAGFSNSYGGKLIVGVNDLGNEIGLEKLKIDEYKNLVLTTIERYFQPHIDVNFKTKKIKNDRYLLEIIIDPSEELVVYKDGDYNESVYLRKDGATVKASVKEIIALGKRKYGIDTRILKESYYKKDYSKYFKLAKKYRKDNKEPSRELLISKEIINIDGQITEGFKMFSDNYNNDDSIIMCRIWNGFNKGVDEVIDMQEIKGPLGECFIESINFIIRNTRKGFIKLKDGSRLDTSSYPEIALREAIVNAIVHRDYSIDGSQIDIDIYKDRLVISSPGEWLLTNKPGDYDMDKIPSIRRNKVICNCFEIAGLMEKSGSGLRKIFNSYKGFAVDVPKLESINNMFVITLYDLLYDKTNGIMNEINFGKYDRAILDYCIKEPKTREEIQKYIGYKSRGHFSPEVLKPLIDKKLLLMVEAKQSKKQRYLTNNDMYKI